MKNYIIYIFVIFSLLTSIIFIDVLYDDNNIVLASNETSLIALVDEVTTSADITSTMPTTTTVTTTTKRSTRKTTIKTTTITTTQIKTTMPNKYIGTISISNSNFKETLVKATNNDNSYYLSHDINGNKSAKGLAVIDYRTDFINTNKMLIYGHSFKNGGGPFNYLQNYYTNPNFYKEHKYIYIDYNYVHRVYEIFSIYKMNATDKKDSELEYFNNVYYPYSETYEEVLNNYKNNSLYDTNVNVNKNDKILILQTCTIDSDQGKYYKSYILIFAKRIE